MRIKRYFGSNIRDAIRKVREEQGPDAVILSNREVEGGFEIVAAIDFEEVLLTPEGLSPVPSGSDTSNRATPNAVQPRSEFQHTLNQSVSRRQSRAGRSATSRRGSSELSLEDMRREMKNMRGLLEQQISGMALGDMARRNPVQANLLRLLMQLELSPKLCRQIVTDLERATDPQNAWREALGVLAHKIPVTNDDILEKGGVVTLVGPTGVGKTTTIAKLAARYAVRHGSRRVALITTDNYRIGAHEHLRAYARILDIPLRVVTSGEELHATLKDLANRKLVLIDTAGMSQRDLRLKEQFSLIREASSRIRNYLVLSATTNQSSYEEIITAYGRLGLNGCVLTKVDEANSLGGALSAIVKHRLPVAYMSDGQRVPEDLYAARAHSLVSRSVTLMRQDTFRAAQQPIDSYIGGLSAHAF